MNLNKKEVYIESQKFVSKEIWNVKKTKISLPHNIHQTHNSSSFVDDDNFYKLIKTNSYIKSNYRLLTGNSKTNSEILGNRTLQKFNCMVPELKYHGTSIFSKQHNEILIYENMKDFITLKEALKDNNNEDFIREVLLKTATDLNRLINTGIYIRDFHFDNVMTNPDGELCWIDTSISFFEKKEKMHFKVNKKMKVLNNDIINNRWLNENSWNFFKDNIQIINT